MKKSIQMQMSKGKQLLLLFSFCFTLSYSQTISFNLLQAPCNADGQLEFTLTGVNIPCTVNLYFAGTGTSQSYTLNSTTDIIPNYTGELVYVYASDGTQAAWGNFTSPPFTYSVNTTPANCPSLTGVATVTISGGQSPYSFDWVSDQNPSVIVATGNPVNLTPGGYAVTITDANGCVFSSNMGGDSIFIWNQSGITINKTTTPASCTNGSVTVSSITGGTAPYTYLWNNGATTSSISGLTYGAYTITVTDANGCSDQTSAFVQQSVTIGANAVTSPATCLQNDGSVITFGSGGMPPYTYQYSNNANTQTVNGLTAGSYSVTVTDANGCTGYGWFSISSSTPITVNDTIFPSSCTAPTGSAQLAVTGGTAPYTIDWFTFPSQTGNTLSGMSAGTYAFQVTDANGCVRSGAVQIPFINPLYANISYANTICTMSNGSATVNAWGGTPPISYSWNTGATTNAINSLSSGGYSCSISDAAGCTLVKSAYVADVSTIYIGFNTTPTSCIYTADGSVVANASGGQSPYTYYWSSGQTGNTATGLSAGYHTVYVTDANGCTKNQTIFVPSGSNNSCYCTIEGYVYNDLNGNCIQDNGEPGIENIMMHCVGFGYAFTNANGYYAFQVPSGTYTISQVVQSIYPLASCQLNNQVVIANASSNCSLTYDFANTIVPLHDIKVTNLAYIPPVIGNLFTQYTIVKNNGTVGESGIQLSYKHDGQLPFVANTDVTYVLPDPTNEPDWFTVPTGFPALAAGDDITILNYFQTPTNIPLGTVIDIRDTVCYQSPITDWVNDYTPWNNIHQYNPVVVSSYDPNFKEVSPKGEGLQGNITRADEYLNYVVHFQNTGSWPAQLVVIRDTLDSDLNWETLQPGYSDHIYTASIDNNGVLTFRFENINLPDSTSNPLGSMGLVTYSIKVKDNLPAGTEITNTAGIYFDFNAPVITNTTLNTITDSLLSSPELMDEKINATIFPNPAQDNATLMITSNSNEITSIVISDITGKIILERIVTLAEGHNYIPMPIEKYESGLYFVTIQSDEKMKSLRLVKN